MIKKQAEEIALTGGAKSIEHMRILSDGEMREDFYTRARLRQPLET
jgi:hypothetical protein